MKSPWEMHLQLIRIAKGLRRMGVYKPYTALLIDAKVHKIICKYIDNMRANGIDIDKERNTPIERKIYAGY
jgi:hypothetical protein